MKKIDLKCSSCGATMEFDEEKKIAICPFCKNKSYFDKEPDIEEVAKNKEKITYAEELGRRKAIEDYTRSKKLVAVLIILAIVTVILIAIVGSSMIKYKSLELIEDPFNCIDVEFIGNDTYGKVEIIDNKKCDYYEKLQFLADKDSKLKENEIIKISVSSDEYRFKKRTNEYKVFGLMLYLNDLDSLNKEMINKMHLLSSDKIKKDAVLRYSKGKLKGLKRYKMYLLTDSKNKNHLFDIYTVANLANNGKTYTNYAVAHYEDFLLTNDESLFKYSFLNNEGNIIAAGDPKAYSALDKGYIGNMVGFASINDFEAYLNRKYDSTFKRIVK